MSVENIPFGRPMIDEAERAAVRRVLEGNVLVHGPIAVEFESAFARYSGSKHAVSMSSCTAALHLSYFSLGIGAGDEVIVPAMSHVATVHAVELVGARPVFVDAVMPTGNINIAAIEEKITPQTRALTLVHYLGIPVEMDRIMALAAKYKLKVVEDCALGVGSLFKDQHVGTFGNTGCFSFYPIKHLTTAEGGMLLTQDETFYKKVKLEKAFGVDRSVGERAIPGEYDVLQLGFNYRMNELQAAIGIEQVKKADIFAVKRKENFEALESGLANLDGVVVLDSDNKDCKNSYYCLSIVLEAFSQDHRYKLMAELQKNGIGCSIYYPRAIPDFTYYKQKYPELQKQNFSVARKIAHQSVALPVGPHLNTQHMERISEVVRATIKNFRSQ